MSSPRLYLVTDRQATGGRRLADLFREALADLRPGSKPTPPVGVQLREKDLSGAALHALARDLRAVTAEHGASLYVNDRVDVALAVGADGVHLGRAGLSVADVRAIAPDLRIGVSTHAPAEVEAARTAGADFAVFGPVFATASKPGARARGIEALGDACRAGLPVLALGGVTPENARACLAAGAAGVACIGAVAQASDPRAAVRLFLRCF